MSCFLPVKHLQHRWLADLSGNLTIRYAISHVMEDCNKIISSSKFPSFLYFRPFFLNFRILGGYKFCGYMNYFLMGPIFKGNSAVAKRQACIYCILLYWILLSVKILNCHFQRLKKICSPKLFSVTWPSKNSKNLFTILKASLEHCFFHQSLSFSTIHLFLPSQQRNNYHSAYK